MTKYIKQRLSVKIFIITLLLLGAACSGTYLFISKLLPTTYSNLINAATEKAAMHLVEQMTAFDNISDCENDISNFSKETNAAFWIEDSNGRIIYPDEASMETSNTSADYTVTFDEDESFIDMQPSGATTTKFYPFTLKNGTAYSLAVQTDQTTAWMALPAIWPGRCCVAVGFERVLSKCVPCPVIPAAPGIDFES